MTAAQTRMETNTMPRTRGNRRHGRDQRLTEDDVRAIRAAYRPGDRISALSERYQHEPRQHHRGTEPTDLEPPGSPGRASTIRQTGYIRDTRRVEKKGRAVVTVPAAPTSVEENGAAPGGSPSRKPARPANARAATRNKKPLGEENRSAPYGAPTGPESRLAQLEDKFGVNGMTIISIVNRCTYSEYETAENEYEPPPHIRSTRRREAAVTTCRERQTLPIHRTDTKHLIPEAVRAIREAINDGEPIPRIVRSFGLTPEAIEHMKRVP